VSELRENELLIEREFNAPVSLVFRLWESRDHMLRWWGPEKFTAIELNWELTHGRPWRGAMTSKQYGLSRFGGVIHEVENNKRIVFTFQWDEDSGRDRDTLVTVTFAERGGNTVQTFHQAHLEGKFTVGDLIMADVLRILDHTDLLESYPHLSAYKRRCEARPAFRRAMKAQIDGFKNAA
jgi:uncharacterized protein YndB with AHSA1/START domain